MDPQTALFAAGLALAILLAAVTLALQLRHGGTAALQRQEAENHRLALAAMQHALETAQRVEAEALRGALTSAERALSGRTEQARIEQQAMLADLTTRLVREQGEQRVQMETKLREMADHAALRLADIQRSVNERLAESIEKQMQGSFQRVIDQFTQLQAAMTGVQSVAAQIGDLKRIFSNVKSRGAWGEMQLRAMLTDCLPAEAWATNQKLRPDSDEAVEFVLLMPSRATPRPVLALDAKFPTEDYDRLLLAAESGDTEGERTARRALETRLRTEARKIATKYIAPPVTVDFAILYLPTDGLYVEAARIPGLLETLNREHRVLVMGPALLPALLRTLHLGAMTLTVEQRAQEINQMLGAVLTEFGKFDDVLAKLEKQSGTIGNTVQSARTRTRTMLRTLRGVAALPPAEAESALNLEDAPALAEEPG